ncbi:MAG: HAD family phosphatase [Fervidobacterium sp.]|nr:HAD family phosphatase [Fervidobacterium sp.]
MIRNIIFDLGRVLIDWRPYEYMVKEFGSEVAIFLWKNVFDTVEWNLMDKGEITEEQLWNMFKEKFPEYKEYIEKMSLKVPELLTPISENVELLMPLKRMGYQLYVLSNFSRGNFNYVYKKFEFFKIFDGMIISGFVKQIKPEVEIYQTLIFNFNLNPFESLFIDDKEENIKTAKFFGFNVIHLPDHSLLKERLENILGKKINYTHNEFTELIYE